jgi:hypothetical protein
MDRFRETARSHARGQAWVVLSWDPRAPRATVRLDGYYLIRSDAAAVAARGGWGRRQGYHALVLEVVRDGSTRPGIPDALFDAPEPDENSEVAS